MHQSTEVREGFQEWIEGYWQDWQSSRIKAGLDFKAVVARETLLQGEFEDSSGEKWTLQQFIGLLWDCTDTLPSADCDLLDISTGSTYAQAVRNLDNYVKTGLAH